MNDIQLIIDESGFCKVIDGTSTWGQGFDVWEAIGDAAHNMGCCVSQLGHLVTDAVRSGDLTLGNNL